METRILVLNDTNGVVLMEYKKCRHVEGKSCSIVRDTCPFWANDSLQQYCEKVVQTTMIRYRSKRKPELAGGPDAAWRP